MKTILYAAILFATAFTCGTGQAQEQNTSGSVEVIPDYILRRILADEPEQTLTRLSEEGRIAQGVIVGTKRWDTTSPIRVCFFGGGVQLRQRIVQVASAWENLGTTIQLDFGDRSNPTLCRSSRQSDIRIGYSQPGYWSMIGQDSLVYVGQFEQSMNLARFDYAPPREEEFNRIVLHEFGHALGFNHEHQQARVGCEDEFDWPLVVRYLSGPPNNWSEETINFNLRSRVYMAGDIATPFNRNSIMLYSFPVEFYREGERSRCYSPGNSALSPGDADLLRLAYGTAAPSRQTNSATLIAAAQSLPADERAGLQERVRLFNADRATKNQILGIGDKRYTDVDIVACSDSPGTLALVETASQLLSTEPRLGLLRYRGIRSDSSYAPGLTVLADISHPEIADARRLVTALGNRLTNQVALAENPGSDRWLLTVVACASD